ncbi:MAG: MFS transporter [Lachnospiraceae bacterium]|nr:MFS transporter [Lachnospiraceae bacterium]
MNSNNNTKSNFGKWGWSMIIYCAISYYLAAALSTDALNWFPSAFQVYHGWGEEFVNMCNTMAGVGGWIGVVAAVVFSMMTAKKGSRFMAVFGNIITGILCLIMAFTGSQPVFYLMVICLTFVGGNIQLNVVPNNIMNVWFPKKKGLALGWASMGLPICTATIIVIFSAIGNPRTAYILLGAACFAFAIVSLFWAKNTPEEVGCTPDNEPVDLGAAKALMEKQEEAAKKMTMGVIAKDKNTWLIGIGHGLLWMTTIGLVSNFVTKMVMTGIDSNFAVTMLTVAAVIGIIGSYIWGWLDQKFSTKTASLIYGCWYLVALLIMIFQNGSTALVILAAVFVGFGIGDIGNLIPSIIGTCFGRFGFIQANRLIAPMNTAVRSTALVIIGAVGVANLNRAYMIFFAGSVVAIFLICLIKPDQKKVNIQ